jgi:L-threonylcarbamoyladenylate synthase
MKETNQVISALRRGGVVLLPTDTVYGLAALPDNPEAINKIFTLKERPRDAALPIMVATADDLETLGLEITPAARRLLASRFVPGALTLVLGFGKSDRPMWLSGREEVGVRIPNDPLLLGILQQTGPLLVTSANRHGRKTPDNVPAILQELVGAPDLVLERGRGEEIPSTVVNCRRKPPLIERLGAVDPSEIEKLIHDD